MLVFSFEPGVLKERTTNFQEIFQFQANETEEDQRQKNKSTNDYNYQHKPLDETKDFATRLHRSSLFSLILHRSFIRILYPKHVRSHLSLAFQQHSLRFFPKKPQNHFSLPSMPEVVCTAGSTILHFQHAHTSQWLALPASESNAGHEETERVHSKRGRVRKTDIDQLFDSQNTSVFWKSFRSSGFVVEYLVIRFSSLAPPPSLCHGRWTKQREEKSHASNMKTPKNNRKMWCEAWMKEIRNHSSFCSCFESSLWGSIVDARLSF